MFLSVFISDFRLVQNIFIYSNLIEEIYLTVKNQVWFIWGKKSSLFYILFFFFFFFAYDFKMLKRQDLNSIFFNISKDKFEKVLHKGRFLYDLLCFNLYFLWDHNFVFSEKCPFRTEITLFILNPFKDLILSQR